MELSIGEMLVVFLVILVLFGPDKIPSIARELGQGVRKMKSAVDDIKTEIMKESDNPISDIKKEIDDIKNTVSDINPMNDIQRHIESMKDSINPMEQNIYEDLNETVTDLEPKTESNIDSDPQVSEKIVDNQNKEQLIGNLDDKLNDEYSGAVSR